MQCLAVYSTPTKQELQPNFQRHDSRNVCTLLQLQSRLCNVSVRVNHGCWVSFTITAPDSQRASCIMDARGYFCFMCWSREPQPTLPSRVFAVLPLLQAPPSEHLWLSPFPISTDPNLDSFFFSLQEMIIDKVNGQPVPRYLIYDIIKFNVSSATKECVVALWDLQSPQATTRLLSLSFHKGVFFLTLEILLVLSRFISIYNRKGCTSSKSMVWRCLLGNLCFLIFAWVLQRRY